MSNPQAYATQYTRTGKLNMQNRKPYRTASQKEVAQRMAYKGEDGTYHSSAPVSFHGAYRQREVA
jgi:hypothetical protein